jgi:hypothetical protein
MKLGGTTLLQRPNIKLWIVFKTDPVGEASSLNLGFKTLILGAVNNV